MSGFVSLDKLINHSIASISADHSQVHQVNYNNTTKMTLVSPLSIFKYITKASILFIFDSQTSAFTSCEMKIVYHNSDY